MSKLAERVKDKRLLVLIGKMLKAKVVMPNGVVVNNEEGVPQGGPLSPLLSNVVLDDAREAKPHHPAKSRRNHHRSLPWLTRPLPGC